MAADVEAIKAAMQQRMKENSERPNSGHRPPGLEVTESSRKNCGTCSHFEHNMCQLYDYRVQPNEVCESWSPQPE
jgi:hypothetical protein